MWRRAALAAVVFALIGVGIAERLLDKEQISFFNLLQLQGKSDVGRLVPPNRRCVNRGLLWRSDVIDHIGGVDLWGETETIIAADKKIEQNNANSAFSEQPVFPLLLIDRSNKPLRLVSLIRKQYVTRMLGILTLSGEHLLSHLRAPAVHFLNFVHIAREWEQGDVRPSFHRWRWANVFESDLDRDVRSGVKNKWPLDAGLDREPRASSGLHFIQLALHHIQLPSERNPLLVGIVGQEVSQNGYRKGRGSRKNSVVSINPFYGGSTAPSNALESTYTEAPNRLRGFPYVVGGYLIIFFGFGGALSAKRPANVVLGITALIVGVATLFHGFGILVAG